MDKETAVKQAYEDALAAYDHAFQNEVSVCIGSIEKQAYLLETAKKGFAALQYDPPKPVDLGQ